MLADGEAEADIEGDMDGEAIELAADEGAVPGSAVAPPPQAARVSGNAIAALRAAMRAKRELLDILVSSWRNWCFSRQRASVSREGFGA
jgi:hypothetical protein